MYANYPALVLNADFRPLSAFPLSLLNWQDTVRLVVQDKLIEVEHYDKIIRSPSTEIQLPSVVATREYIKTPGHVAFTRNNVFLRDHYTCQYCGQEFEPRDLSYDHVVPRALGGTTVWTNIATACVECNTRKGHGVSMQPLRPPRKPKPHELLMAKIGANPADSRIHESWKSWLWWNTELDP